MLNADGIQHSGSELGFRTVRHFVELCASIAGVVDCSVGDCTCRAAHGQAVAVVDATVQRNEAGKCALQRRRNQEPESRFRQGWQAQQVLVGSGGALLVRMADPKRTSRLGSLRGVLRVEPFQLR